VIRRAARLLVALAVLALGALTTTATAGAVASTRTFGFIDPALANTGGPPSPPRPGVALTGGSFSDHGLIPFGDAATFSKPVPAMAAPVVDFAPTPKGDGAWLATADGAVATLGNAALHGSTAGGLVAPVVGIAAARDGGGYWMVALDGGVFGFGDATFFGSMGGHRLNAPIVGMAATPDGRGYWLVASDGGVFGFGDAAFFGSTGGLRLYAPIVGIAATPDGRGYWLVASDGGVFGFGDARFFGSMGSVALRSSVVGLASTPDGRGYWMASEDGAVFSFGDAGFHGADATTVPTPPVAGIAATPDGGGYWLLDQATATVGLSAAAGDTGGGVRAAIVDAAAGRVGGNPTPGYYCNPYGPCEEWCALFATWAWEQAGVPIPRYAFTGDIFTWAAQHTAVLPPWARPSPGDAVLYGTGAQTADSSLHVGIVVRVWPDGAMVTVDGDAGPGPPGSHSVTIDGPFLPGDSTAYTGMPIYGYAVP
jgi:hypothetical protein